MKKILSLLLILISIAGYAQTSTFGGIGLRVNDTTTYQANAVTLHSLGYYDIYFNNQATNDHWDVWNGSSYDHIFAFGQGSGTSVWGSITGTLSDQTDLQTALDAKVNDTGNETIAGVKTFSSDPLIPDEAYDATNWNGVLEPPTKNAVRDKIETLANSFVATHTIWVDSLGSDVTGTIGRQDKPFATINAALDAGASVKALKIIIGMGSFTSPDSAKLRSNLWLHGAGKPGYNGSVIESTFGTLTITDPTGLRGGTILKGTVTFRNKRNVKITDLGVDCGSAYVTGGGTEGNQLVFLSSHLVANWTLFDGIVLKNITTLGRTASSAFHGIQLENCFRPIVDNADTYFSTHGIVYKNYGGIINNVRCNKHTSNGIILKTDSYAFGLDNIISNFEIQGGGGLRIDNGSGTAGVRSANISNGVIKGTTFGVKTESSIAQASSYITIHNVKAHGISGIGFDIANFQSGLLSDCYALGCTGDGFNIVQTSTNTLTQLVNCYAEANTIGFDITASSSSAYLYNNRARSNSSNGFNLTGSVFGIGNAADGNGGSAISGTMTSIGLTQRNFFGGTSTPTSIVHIGAGTTAANSAPLKIASGPLMTTPEASAIEFLTDKWYATITTGAARKEFTLNDAALTSGRVPFATTNGRITDDSDMTFATDKLTVTKLQIASGADLTGHLSATASLNFDLTSVNIHDLTITVTGAVDGNTVAIGVPNGSTNANVIYTAWVSAADTVTIRASRVDVASGADPASGTFRATVLKY